jgi:hypothetical protein
MRSIFPKSKKHANKQSTPKALYGADLGIPASWETIFRKGVKGNNFAQKNEKKVSPKLPALPVIISCRLAY